MSLLEHIPALVAFAAVLLGIFGKPKFNPEESGLRRLSLVGYATVGIAAVALVVSVLLTMAKQEEADFLRAQRKEIKRIAHRELRVAIHEILQPFHDTGPHLVPLNFDPFNHEYRENLASLDLNAPHPKSLGRKASPVIRQARAYQDAAIQGAQDIDRVLQIYSTYLESDVLLLISSLQTNEFLWRLENLDDHVTEQIGPFRYQTPESLNPLKPAVSDDPVRFYYVGKPNDSKRDWGYERFWSLIVELDCRLIGKSKDSKLLRTALYRRGYGWKDDYPQGQLFHDACDRHNQLAAQQGAAADARTSRR